MRELDKITPYLKETYQIDEATNYVCKEVEGINLLVSDRLDLISKLKYIEAKEKHYQYQFPMELYKAHLEAFSNGTYEEPGNDSKKSFQNYVDTFDQLILDMKHNGLDSNQSLVPVGNQMSILDGAHRTAISIYYKHLVPTIQFPHISVTYDSYFFKERLLEPKYIDYMVLEYAKYKKNVFCFCFWPKAEESLKEKAFTILKKKTKVIYDKEIFLTYQGYKNFMQQIYHRHEWVGNYQNHHKGVLTKVDHCYLKNKKLHLVVVESKDLEEILGIKEEIREVFKIGKHSVHAPDNEEETIEMLNLLLNENSIHMMNYGDPDKFSSFNQKLEIWKEIVTKQNLDCSEFIIDSSSVLALYGLREPEDIDYMTICKNNPIIDHDDISNHNQYIQYYNKTVEDLILDPTHFLVYQGIKFVTLDVLKEMKQNRGEKKDRDDVKLINTINRNTLYKRYLKGKVALKRSCRDIKRNIKKAIIKVLKAIRLYEPIKKIISKNK